MILSTSSFYTSVLTSTKTAWIFARPSVLHSCQATDFPKAFVQQGAGLVVGTLCLLREPEALPRVGKLQQGTPSPWSWSGDGMGGVTLA